GREAELRGLPPPGPVPDRSLRVEAGSKEMRGSARAGRGGGELSSPVRDEDSGALSFRHEFRHVQCRREGGCGMTDPLVSIDVSEIHEGRLGELQMAMRELVEFVDANETQPLLYSVYFNPDNTRMTVLQVHPDSS